MKPSPFFLTALAATLLPSTVMAGTSSPSGQERARSDKTIVETAVAAGKFKTLATAIQAAGLVDTLQGQGPFTVFAPTDDAFARLPDGTVADLVKPENRELLTAILTYHVVPGRVLAKDVVKLPGAATVNGQRISVAVDDAGVMLDEAKVIQTDIACSNGVIHVIDSVLMPSTMDIIDTAVKNGRFKTLAKAVEAAGLLETLRGEGPFTVFAPTDDAFSKLPDGTVTALLNDKDKLSTILRYHVVPGRVYSDQAVAARMAKSVAGPAIRITRQDGAVMINEARIVTADIDATNGVIHVIDAVILPPSR